MSTVTTNNASVRFGPMPASTPSWQVEGGDNDKRIKRAWDEAARHWWGRSFSLKRIFGRTAAERRSSWSLLAVGVVIISAVAMVTLAQIGHSPTLLLTGLAVGLCGYVLFWGWVAANRYRSRMLWFLERVRCCLAGAGDPGPRQSSRW
jgi:hypothetical protein